ncbi:PilZ domain-containing protein [Candidatus Omnitrophota bacterium]
MTERRRFSRYKARILLKYKRMYAPISKWQEISEIGNISFGGLSFDAHERLPVDTLLILRFQVFTGDSIMRIIEVRAKVVNVKEDILTYRVGVAFIELNKETKDMLNEFMKYLNPPI